MGYGGLSDSIAEYMADEKMYKKRISELEEENRMLRETISGLNYTIRELRARIPDPIVQKTD